MVNLHLDLVPSNTFPFVLLHGCHSKKKGGEGRKEVVQYLDDLNIKNKKKEGKNSRLQLVSSWANASSVGLGPSPQLARQRSVTK